MCLVSKLNCYFNFNIAWFLYYLRKEEENWVNYLQLPLGNIYTSPEPIVLYRKDRYRKPYMYPVCHPVEYPVKHCQHLN